MYEKSIMNYGEEIISSKEEEEKDLDLPYDDLKIKYQNSEKLCRELSETIKNLEGKINETSKSLEEKSRKFETCRNTVKKILSFYLEDEYFIDMIENCFKNKDFYIEETLATSKIIKTSVNVKSYIYILNEIIKPKLYYLKGLDIFNELDLISDEFKSIDQFYHFYTNFSQDENNLVNKFISKLLKKLDTQLNENFELKYELKISNKELDESKKNEIDLKETFFKQISILNKTINGYSKIEKSLKNTIKSVESNLHNIEQSNDNLNKDYLILKENHNQLAIKKLDLEFEKIQLIIKLEENRSELKREKAKNESLIKENEELLTHLEKLKVIIDELKQHISKKESEYNTLENLKKLLQEEFINLEKNLNDLNTEKNDLFKKYQTIELSHDNLKKDYSILKENHYRLEIKKLDLKKKIIQLIIKQEENTTELIKEISTNDSLKLENEELLKKVTQIEKLKDDLNNQIIKKDNDYITLKNSNESSKTYFENFKNEKIKFIKDLRGFGFQFIEHHSQNIEHLVDKKIVSNNLINYLCISNKNNDLKKTKALEELSIYLDLNEYERKKIGLNNSNSNHNLKKENPVVKNLKTKFI